MIGRQAEGTELRTLVASKLPHSRLILDLSPGDVQMFTDIMNYTILGGLWLVLAGAAC
jgi:hypothetical protein